jgi:hypothetical protein
LPLFRQLVLNPTGNNKKKITFSRLFVCISAVIVFVPDVGSPVPAEVRKPLTRTISCPSLAPPSGPSLAPLYVEPDVPAAVADRAEKDKETWPTDTALDKEKSKTR